MKRRTRPEGGSNHVQVTKPNDASSSSDESVVRCDPSPHGFRVAVGRLDPCSAQHGAILLGDSSGCRCTVRQEKGREREESMNAHGRPLKCANVSRHELWPYIARPLYGSREPVRLGNSPVPCQTPPLIEPKKTLARTKASVTPMRRRVPHGRYVQIPWGVETFPDAARDRARRSHFADHAQPPCPEGG